MSDKRTCSDLSDRVNPLAKIQDHLHIKTNEKELTLELREINQSGRVKLLKIVLLNIVLWTATFVGYGYLPELFFSWFESILKNYRFYWYDACFCFGVLDLHWY